MMVMVLSLAAAQPLGTIQGKVSEEQGSRPIAGVLVALMETEFSVLSNGAGTFTLTQIPVGNYRIKFSCSGFAAVIETDIVVRPNRITTLDVKMREEPARFEEAITVEENYFQKDLEVPSSSHLLSTEEIRRVPGSAGFVERVITALPGVAVHGSDENADLLVRGGSPDENGFYIDNIEVPNINHLPRLGSSGGVFSAFNPDLLQKAEFYSGAFSAGYGDRLSSITNITFREGNRNEIDGEVDLNLFMAGMVVDGPIAGGKGSWLIAGRKSYVKLLNNLDILDIGNTLDTKDVQVKLAYDFSPRHKINVLNLLAAGSFRDFYWYEVTEDNRYTQNTLGVNWQALWSDHFFSNTSLAYSFFKRTDSEEYPVNDRDYFWETKDLAQSFSLKNSNFLFFKDNNKLEFGIQCQRKQDDIHYFEHDFYDANGAYFPALEKDYQYSTTQSALYASLGWNPLQRLNTTIGLRGDYSSTHKTFHLSPRFNASLRLGSRISLTGGFGVFYQTMPMRFMAYFPEHVTLKDSRATHYTLGIEYIAGSTKLTLEAFDKEYQNLLIDPDRPQYLATELAIDSYYHPERLTDSGRGYARGIELLIQKKLVKRFHGLVSITIAKSRYRDGNGEWRNSGFEVPFIVNVVAGYKPNKLWEFGLRLTVAGGRPTTPIDEDMSSYFGRIYYILSRVNEIRFPTYNKLNLRGERKFFFRKSNLVLYLDIWNVLNSQVIYEYEWHRNVEPKYHLPIMPIFGLKFEF